MKSSHSLVLSVIIAIAVYLMVRDFNVTLANAPYDDHPSIFSDYLNHPQRYDGDLHVTEVKILGRSSIHNWLPAVLERYAGLPAKIPANIFLFLQNILLVLAFLGYTRIVARQTEALWLVPLLMYASEPSRWNIAFYPNSLQTPYPAQLAIPFLIFAATFALKNRLGLTLATLATASLIHPTLAFHMAFILAVFWVFQCRKNVALLARKILPLLLVSTFGLIPSLLMTGSQSAPLTDAELIGSMFRNKHFVPWTTPQVLDWALPTFTLVVAFSWLCLRKMSWLTVEYRRFYYANLLTVALFSLLQLVGAHFKIVPLLQACPMRVSALVALFVAPIIYTYLLERASKGIFVARWSAWSLMLWHSLFPTGFYLGPALAAWISDVKPLRSSRVRAASLLFFSWLVIFLIAGRVFRYFGASDLGEAIRLTLVPGKSTFTFAGFAFGLLMGQGLALSSIPRFSIPKSSKTLGLLANESVWLGVSVVGIILFAAYGTGRDNLSGERWNRYLAQEWARQSTPEKSVFVVPYVSWRGISCRRTVNAHPFNFHVYTRNRKSQEFGDSVAAFYEAREVTTFEQLDTKGALEFVARFGGNYIVRSSRSPLSLPVAYRNDSLLIYGPLER